MKKTVSIKRKELFMAGSLSDIKAGDTIKILPDTELVYPEKLVQRAKSEDCIPPIPVNVFGPGHDREKLELLTAINYDSGLPGGLAYICGNTHWRYCRFDTSENNWVAYGTHVPWYTGKCPLPHGVMIEYKRIQHESTTMARASELFWDSAHERGGSAIQAFRVVGLAPDFEYSWQERYDKAHR